MSMFNCPVCGKQNSIRFYHPETYDDDVIIFHKIGKGRGKGFQKISGFSLEEFPELRETLGNRVLRVSRFLNPQQEANTEISELKLQLETEKLKRIEAEEELEELDLGILIRKLGRPFGRSFSDLHAAVDAIIEWNKMLSESNRSFVSVNQNLESNRLRLEQEKRNLELERNRLQNENNNLRDNIQKWVEAYKQLETINKNQQVVPNNALILEQKRRIQLEDYLEELDLDNLLYKIQNGTGVDFTDLHAGVDELIRVNRSFRIEYASTLEYVNNVLPEEYDLYDDLDEAVRALYEYYEDYIEELSDG